MATVRTVKPKKSSDEGTSEWRDFEVVRVRLRPGTAKARYEAKFIFEDGIEKRGVVNFVKYFNHLEDEPRRKEARYPLDP